jgi:shikimate dehydrogenase
MKKACVIGHPISHSLSPVIHNYWLNKYEIEGSYQAIDVKESELEDFILNLNDNGYRGCNITLPYKEKVWEILFKEHNSNSLNDSQLPLPRHIANYMQSINTLVYDEQTKELVATNTDFLGFARNLIENAPEFQYNDSVAYIIGAGGASKAIAFALATLNVKQILITNRTKEKSEEIKKLMTENFNYPVEQFDIVDWEHRNDFIENCNLLVNTTSLGMKGMKSLDLDISTLPENSLVTDIIYNPLETNLLKVARELGHITIDGLGMLLHQAAPGFEGWFGTKPEVTSELKRICIEKLGI